MFFKPKKNESIEHVVHRVLNTPDRLAFIDKACTVYRKDFEFMESSSKDFYRWEAIEWLRCLEEASNQ